MEVDPWDVLWEKAYLNDPRVDQIDLIQGPLIVDQATATSELNWLANQLGGQLLLSAKSNDLECFITTLESFRKRLCRFEPIAQQLRDRWARAAVQLDRLPAYRATHFSSAHLCLYCWCRAVLYAVWVAVDAKRFIEATRGVQTVFNSDDVRKRWDNVRKVLASEKLGDVNKLNALIEAERGILIEREALPVVPADRVVPRPHWDAATGNLLFGDGVIRNVAKRARNCIAVLNAFEEEKWPPCVDDPLPGGKNAERLNNTVKTLNSGLLTIRFSVAGDGQSVEWRAEN